MSRPRRQIGPIETAARALEVDGDKRRVVLALTAFLDEGVANPSVPELARRCRIHRMAVTVKLDKLARDGVIALDRGDDRRQERTSYRFLLPIPTTERKDPAMTTQTEQSAAEAAPEAAAKTEAPTDVGAAMREPITRPAPNWQREDFWPEAPNGDWTWPIYVEVRERHVTAAQALAAARQDGDAEAEQAALEEVCESIIDAIPAIRASLPDAEAALGEARRAAVPSYPEGIIPDGERETHAAAVRVAREWSEPDSAAIRRVRTILTPDTFWPPSTDRPVPSIEAKVRQAVGR